MFERFKKKKADPQLYAPVNGQCISLEQVKDPVFQSKMMGEGTAFILEDDTIYAPCDGEISMIAVTKHAIGLTADNKADVLIHVGLDTVNLNGKGFSIYKQSGDKVKRGEALLKVDRSLMESENIDLTTPMVVTNSSEFQLTIVNQDFKVAKGESVVITCE
ncbi:PTS glucose transporter subunit IIA [Enterococcus hulanensis]|uniref:PTS sugar transporter subunit IIA n=1 Tax=Enterococcus TaxID=1350 RepID=UPI000B5A4A32|nr:MULTISPECIES: PTS glucose transporter subunit IIA [Enterococcus]MBO0411439.1 PTS glucose transporter subunit IIA [Enterococcus hulanensis]OTO14185.1 hypothetical protein A5875_003342 [Enterococcus sp. 3H8_DIV0648]